MKLSVSTQSEWLEEREQFAVLKDCGFDGTDLSLERYFYKNGKFADIDAVTDEQIRDYFTDLRREAERAGFVISQVHSQFGGHPRSYGHDIEDIIKREIACIKAAHYLGTKLCVIHPIITPGRFYDYKLQESFEQSVSFYRRLIPTLEEYDVYACIENMWVCDPIYGHICNTILSHADELVRMCDLLGDRFRICLDIGHGLLTGDDPVEMVKTCGSRIACLHTHDNDGFSDLHTFPYAKYQVPYGLSWRSLKTDWTALMRALRQVGYEGSLNFEVSVPAPDPSVQRAGLCYLSAIGRYLSTLFEGSEG